MRHRMTFTRSNLQEVWVWFDAHPQQQECSCHTLLCPVCSFVAFDVENEIPSIDESQHTHPGLAVPRHMVLFHRSFAPSSRALTWRP